MLKASVSVLRRVFIVSASSVGVHDEVMCDEPGRGRDRLVLRPACLEGGGVEVAEGRRQKRVKWYRTSWCQTASAAPMSSGACSDEGFTGCQVTSPPARRLDDQFAVMVAENVLARTSRAGQQHRRW